MSTHAERLLVPSPSPSLAEATLPTCSGLENPLVLPWTTSAPMMGLGGGRCEGEPSRCFKRAPQ
jgi:hypothetical protein